MSLKRKFLLLFVFIFSGILFVISDSYAVPTVTIRVIKTFVNAGSRPIALTTETSGKIKKYNWQITAGPGRFKGKTTDSAVAYFPPEEINQESVEVQITITVTDFRGEKATDGVKLFIVKAIRVTPTPFDIFQKKSVPQLLKEGDYFFARQWYLFERGLPEGALIETITPDKKSAFNRYQEVLKEEFNNKHARKKIQEMMEKYNTLAESYYNRWKRKAYKQEGHRKETKKLYNLCLFVAQYRQNTLGDPVGKQVQTIEKRLQELDSPGYIQVFVDIPVKVYINHQYLLKKVYPKQPGKYKSPPGQTIIQVKADGYSPETQKIIIHPDQWHNIKFKLRLQDIPDLLKEADQFFKLQRYIESKDKESKVAFDVYKEVLEIDPNNEHALEKISTIMKRYKTWGDRAYKRKHFKRAKLYYESYLKVALYRLNTLKDRSISEEIKEIQKRLGNL